MDARIERTLTKSADNIELCSTVHTGGKGSLRRWLMQEVKQGQVQGAVPELGKSQGQTSSAENGLRAAL